MLLRIWTHVRKHLLACLAIGATIEVIEIVLNWDGSISPIAWLISVIFSAIAVYIGLVVLIGLSKLVFPLLNRMFIDKRRD